VTTNIFDGISPTEPRPARTWVYAGIFDGPGPYKLSFPDENGILEIGYPDGVTTLVQGRAFQGLDKAH